MLIIGSTAIKHHFPDFKRSPSDIDFILLKDRDNAKRRERLRADHPDTKVEFLTDPGILKYQQKGYLSPDLLLTLKCSHIFWDVNWDKHMWDIQFLLEKGYKINQKVFDELYAFWNTYHKKLRRSDLDMSAEDFFGNNVIELEIPHDTVHTFLADVPAYTKVLADGAEVQTDVNKFNALSHQEKLDLVIEEVQVMSWERYKTVKWYRGYSIMLKKFIRLHAPMYEVQFIIENWKTLVKCPMNHYELINQKAKEWKLNYKKD